jgi:DNA-binding transcriptional regulator WhiA
LENARTLIVTSTAANNVEVVSLTRTFPVQNGNPVMIKCLMETPGLENKSNQIRRMMRQRLEHLWTVSITETLFDHLSFSVHQGTSTQYPKLDIESLEE